MTRTYSARDVLTCCALMVPLFVSWSGYAHARVDNAEWAKHKSAFKRNFTVPSHARAYDRRKSRSTSLDALKALLLVPDGRAIPLLLGAHAREMRFIKGICTEHNKYRAKWLRELPVRDPVILRRLAEGRSLGANETSWLDWEGYIRADWIRVLEEREVAAKIRETIAAILNRLQGEERRGTMKAVARVVGNGDTAGKIEFLRMLGLVGGPEARTLLTSLSKSSRGLVARHALECLGQQNAAESIGVLLARLDDAQWGTRVAALHGLAHYRVTRVIETLLQRVKGEEGAIRRHYFITLAAITGESMAANLTTWRQFWSAEKNRNVVLARWGDDRGPGRVGTAPTFPTVPGVEESISYYGIKTDSKRIVFVVDLSGSMAAGAGDDEESRLDVARAELKNALGSLTAARAQDPEGGWFNIVAYGSAVKIFRPGKMVSATRQNKAKAVAWLEGREPGGLTNIHDALAIAFELSGPTAVGKGIVEGGDTVFLMTDGRPTRGLVVDPARILEAVRVLNRGRRITIHTIGVDAKAAEDFLRTLARENYGEYIGRGG